MENKFTGVAWKRNAGAGRSLVRGGGLAAVVLAVGSLAAPIADAAPEPVDGAVSITSTAPVPGGFTVGSWSVSNSGASGVLPAGTTGYIFFEGGWIIGLGEPPTTVTALSGVRVEKDGAATYKWTLTKDLKPGEKISGSWSNSHWLYVKRATARIRLADIPGRADVNPANDDVTYNNGGEGF